MSIGKIIEVKGSVVAEFTSTIILVALLACATSFGQSAAPVTELPTFQVRGTIRAFNDSAVRGAGVTFESQKISVTVSSDKSGSYEANLPVGLYTMTAKPVERYLQRYRRPLFRVASPTSLTFNITLGPAGPFCDSKKPMLDQPLQAADDGVRICGGGDSFPAPSQDQDKVPFDLFIQYETRRPTDRGYTYNTGEHLPGSQSLVFVAYNLFTLQADHIVYDVQRSTLEAMGDVVVENADGTTQRADSMTFKIENGEATLLPPLQTDKNTLSTNECFAKGGLGIVSTNLYIDLKSDNNELLLSAGNRWVGQGATTQEVAIFFDNKIWPPQALPNGFDLSKSAVISFEGDKVRFFDFGKMSGGYYKRPKQN